MPEGQERQGRHAKWLGGMDARSSLSAHACFASVKVRALSLTRSTPTQDTYIFVYRCHKAFEGSDQQQLNPHTAVKWYALTVTGCLGLSVLDQVVNKPVTHAHADQSCSVGAVVCGASKTRDGLPSISSFPPLRTPSEGSASRDNDEVFLKCEIPRKKESARSTQSVFGHVSEFRCTKKLSPTESTHRRVIMFLSKPCL